MLQARLPGRYLAASIALVACLAVGSASRAMRFLTVTDIPSTASWGPTSQGLRLSLSLPQTSYRVGDPILATVDLENLGPDHNVSLGCNMEQWYDIGIVDDRGKALPRLPAGAMVCGATPSSSLMKHDSVLEVTLRLDDKFRISEAGSYTVTATSTIHLPSTLSLDSSGNQKYDNPILASLVSNAVKIDVQSKSASRHMSCAKAASLLAAGSMLPRTVASDADSSIDHYQVKVLAAVDPRGKLLSVSVAKTSGCVPLDKAALKATAKMKWKGDNGYQTNRVVWIVQDHL